MSTIDDAKVALGILHRDHDRLEDIDRYIMGDHDDPYIPAEASNEYKLLAKRSVTNWMPMMISAPAQTLYVENFRPSATAISAGRVGDGGSPGWDCWQRSGMDGRQASVYRAAIGYGMSYVVVETNDDGEPIMRGLSPLRTAMIFDDPANDIEPIGALYLVRHRRERGDGSVVLGKAFYWDEVNRYELAIDDGDPRVVASEPHGMDKVPVTRFAPQVDLDGRCIGVVEPLKPLNDRFNQTIMDLLMAQSFTSFEVRTVSGMAPPMKMTKNEDGELVPVLDESGNPIPDRTVVNAQRWMFAKDPDTKFGTLSAGNLDGFISAADMALKHLSAIGQVPPNFMLGQMANLSAEALQSAEMSLSRMTEEYRHTFGESWERVFRLVAELVGDEESAQDNHAEVVWRDMHNAALSATADGLGKVVAQLGVPGEGVWDMVPGVDPGRVAEWHRLADEQNTQKRLVDQAIGQGPLQPPAEVFKDEDTEVTNDGATG